MAEVDDLENWKKNEEDQVESQVLHAKLNCLVKILLKITRSILITGLSSVSLIFRAKRSLLIQITDVAVVTVQILSYGDLLGWLLPQAVHGFFFVFHQTVAVLREELVLHRHVLRDGVEDTALLALPPLPDRGEGEVWGWNMKVSKGRIQKYLLCNLVDFSIKWWVGSRESIKLIEAIFSI